MKISDKVKSKVGLVLLVAVQYCVVGNFLAALVLFIQHPSLWTFLTTFLWFVSSVIWSDIVIKEVRHRGWKEGYREASDKWKKWREEDNEAWVTALQESSNRWRNFCAELVKNLEDNHERK